MRQAADFIERCRTDEVLRDADRRKDEFLATLAHELRNPLAPVRKAIQILQIKGPANPELEWARAVIDREMQQMTRLVDDLIDVSRITRGTLELRKERVGLARVLQGAVETSRPLIDGSGHELTVALPSDPVYLNADLTRLAQVFSNLLNNAAKYSERGGGISLTAERQGVTWLSRCATPASASPRGCCPGSSTCSPRWTGPWSGPGAGWESA
jgi:signal transduction histidine kinase